MPDPVPEVVPGSEGGAPAVVVAPTRPDNVPEKFWNAETGAVNTEALLASYAEAERKLSEAPPQVEAPPAIEAPASVTNQEAYKAAATRASEELAQAGAISDETYGLLEAAGVPREAVDAHVAGQNAMFELRTLQVSSEVGGPDQYRALLDWAVAGSYTVEEAEAFNAAVFGPDKNAALEAVRTLQNRYNEAMGTEGRMVMGESANTVPGGYTTKSEWLADIRKPEYKTDPAFRASVEKKLQAALQNGVPLGVSINRR
ncbi:capsid assembly protein [Stenotrophomonas maltophilia]|uniref:capsid assembly protein n=1 Tax=Stenotrophomonas maltophilia TaxID=40324 RepID=UPI0013DC00F6|nr:hypothetical protein [Stenotrophomonas maltophilia]